MRNKAKEMTTIKYDELKSQTLDIDPDLIQSSSVKREDGFYNISEAYEIH